MILLCTILIIFLGLSTTALITVADYHVCKSEKNIKKQIEKILKTVKKLQEQLKALNKKLDLIKRIQKINLMKIIENVLNALNLFVLLAPTKKYSILKKIFSIKFIKSALALASLSSYRV